MKEEILINVTPGEVRAAVLDDGVLQELLVERVSNSGLLGNIYKGRVSRVLPGMQAAFINVGLQRTAFLHASDVIVPTAMMLARVAGTTSNHSNQTYANYLVMAMNYWFRLSRSL